MDIQTNYRLNGYQNATFYSQIRENYSLNYNYTLDVFYTAREGH